MFAALFLLVFFVTVFLVGWLTFSHKKMRDDISELKGEQPKRKQSKRKSVKQDSTPLEDYQTIMDFATKYGLNGDLVDVSRDESED